MHSTCNRVNMCQWCCGSWCLCCSCTFKRLYIVACSMYCTQRGRTVYLRCLELCPSDWYIWSSLHILYPVLSWYNHIHVKGLSFVCALSLTSFCHLCCRGVWVWTARKCLFAYSKTGARCRRDMFLASWVGHAMYVLGHSWSVPHQIQYDYTAIKPRSCLRCYQKHMCFAMISMSCS